MRKRHPGTVHSFTMSGSSQQTAAFGSQTYEVRIATNTQPAHWALSGDPTATTSSNVQGINVVDYVTVNPGEKIAVLQAGTAGLITVTELV
jgi:hypothetical protein